MDLLRRISPEPARLVERAASLGLNRGLIILSNDDELHFGKDRSLTQEERYDLFELGVLADRVDDIDFGIPGKLEGATHKRVLEESGLPRVHAPSRQMQMYPFTRMGQEMCDLASAKTNIDHLVWLKHVYSQSRLWVGTVFDNTQKVSEKGECSKLEQVAFVFH